jgi:hypothetical protein
MPQLVAYYFIKENLRIKKIYFFNNPPLSSDKGGGWEGGRDETQLKMLR